MTCNKYNFPLSEIKKGKKGVVCFIIIIKGRSNTSYSSSPLHILINYIESQNYSWLRIVAESW